MSHLRYHGAVVGVAHRGVGAAGFGPPVGPVSRGAHDARSGSAVAPAVGVGHLVAHPAAGLHRRARVLHRRARGPLFLHRAAIWFRISGFWTKLFAVSFGMGVVSGIIMPFQFGTNWSRFSDITADVLSPLLAYEGLTAFFLEASFLGVLLFGRRLVPRWMHFFAAIMVAFGTLLSSFWILSTNSWMQTPAGLHLHRRSLLSGRLARDHLQSVVSVSPDPQRHCVLHHDRVRGDGGRRLAAAPRARRSTKPRS